MHGPNSHLDPEPPSDEALAVAEQLVSISQQPQSPPVGPDPPPASARVAQLDHAAPFLGDINPESVFVEATMTEISKVTPVETQGDARVGFWGTIDRDTNPKEATDLFLGHNLSSKPHLVFYTDSGDKRCVPVTDPLRFANYASEILVDELAAVVRPLESQWAALRNIYSTKIHPIFPIFDDVCLRDLAQEPPRIAELIKASVCLAAASDWDAAKHLFLNLNLPGSQERHRKLVPYGEYSKTVISFIKETTTILQAKTSRDMISKLRIMTLTCMYWQPEPSARSEPLIYYAVLASTVHTYGYHLKAIDANHPDAETADRDGVSRLFKCIYALDRLISAFWARPVMFHNYDLLMTPSPQSKSESPSFKLFWSIIKLLDQVIELYRPHAAQEEVHHINVPVLERLILEASAESVVPDGVLASLEVLYHAVCVTSVRMPRDRFKTSPQMDEGGDLSYRHLPPSILNARRSHSSDRIFDITKDRLRYKLSPMPFIPYALSLSLTVAYRKWKFSRTGMFRVRGFEDFAQTLAVLRTYGKIWTSARINSNLGNLVMERLDRVKQLEAESRSKQATTSAARLSSKARRGPHPDARPPDDVPMPRAENETSAQAAVGDALPRPSDTSSMEAAAPETAWINVTGDPIDQEQNRGSPGSPSLTRTPGLSNAHTTSSDPFSPYPPPSYLGDLPFLTGTGEDATFESWDMADSVDNFFGSNLDLGNPLFWPGPGYTIDGGS